MFLGSCFVTKLALKRLIMKFIKEGKVIDSKTGAFNELMDHEKVMTISVVVPKDFDGLYCQKCPIWYGDISCGVVGICPLEQPHK